MTCEKSATLHTLGVSRDPHKLYTPGDPSVAIPKLNCVPDMSEGFVQPSTGVPDVSLVTIVPRPHWPAVRKRTTATSLVLSSSYPAIGRLQFSPSAQT
jgi:hypothetical protein